MTTTDVTGGIHPRPTWAGERHDRYRVSVVRLLGEFDEQSGANLAERVAQALAERPRAMVLDLTEVDFIGSAALSALVVARRGADEAGIAMALVATRRVTLLPLELTGLARVFSVFPTVREAIAELGGHGPNALSA
ncbi:MAG TPA: STAS domain-containing protein [Pseudonocardiaceae bacterium]|jgi:anti-anti-sigma factor